MNPLTNKRSESVVSLGEEKLIAAIRGWLGAASPRAPFGIGDDCAVLPPCRGPQLITVDPVIYGRHFDHRIPARAVGAKLLKRNLSDLAAMGGRPIAAVLALTLDRRTSVRWLASFYRGLAAAARTYGVSVVGGDVAQADGVVAATLTLLGEATSDRFLTRRGARLGDHIYVTGNLGNSLRSKHHFRFSPRLREGSWLTRQKIVRSMMDVSDGLAKDLHALTPSALQPALFPTKIPCRRGADLRAALTDGEDYELVFTVAKNADCVLFERAWRRAFPRTRLTRAGYFVAKRDLPRGALNLDDYRGYEHLR
ncbi:MAG: thiamine-phosphate kinase [Opitutaceae bacterium]